VTIILSNLNRFKKNTGRFLRKLVVKWVFKKSHRTFQMLLHYLVKHQNKPSTINYKVVQLHIEGVVGLLMTKLGKYLINILHSYKQERDCFVHFLRYLAVCWPGVQSALVCNFAKYLPIKKISLTTQHNMSSVAHAR